MEKEDWLITDQEVWDHSLLFNPACSLHKKDSLLSISKPEGNHANPIHLHFLFIFRLKYFSESNNKNSTEFHTDSHSTKLEVQAPTFTRTATASSRTEYYDVILMC